MKEYLFHESFHSFFVKCDLDVYGTTHSKILQYIHIFSLKETNPLWGNKIYTYTIKNTNSNKMIKTSSECDSNTHTPVIYFLVYSCYSSTRWKFRRIYFVMTRPYVEMTWIWLLNSFVGHFENWIDCLN